MKSVLGHHAGRSLQIGRSLPVALTLATLGDIIARLADCVCDQGDDARGYGIEILLALQSMIVALESADDDGRELARYPQFFWAAVAMLETDRECEFLLAVQQLTSIVTTRAYNSGPFADAIRALGRELGWSVPEFAGVQALLLKGLAAASTAPATMRLLSQLVPYCSDPIFDLRRDGILLNAVALCMHLLPSFRQVDEGRQQVAAALAMACQARGFANLAKLLMLFEKSSFAKSEEAWVDQFIRYLGERFFPDHIQAVYMLVVEVLEKGPREYRLPSLLILNALVKQSVRGR